MSPDRIRAWLAFPNDWPRAAAGSAWPGAALRAWGRRRKQVERAGIVGRLAFIKDLARQLNGAGVRLLVGSDSPTVLLMPGFSISRELDLFQTVLGLTPLEALRLDTAESRSFLVDGFIPWQR